MDVYVVKHLNDVAAHSVAARAAVIAFAVYGIFLLALSPVITRKPSLMIRAYGAALVAFLINVLIGFIRFRPRPFVVHPDIIKLVDVSPLKKSFPSGHTTVAFAIAMTIFFWNKKWGVAALVLATLIGLSRVAVGVHYPSDIIGGAVLGFGIALLIRKLKI